MYGKSRERKCISRLKGTSNDSKVLYFFWNIQNIDQGGITIEREMQEQYFYTHFRS